jgi:RNA-directed DNA polymerase
MLLNSDKPWPSLDEARQRVLDIQRKLHRWTKDDGHQRYGDLYNLVYDQATLLLAWERVKSNRGSRTAGIDGATRCDIEQGPGVTAFLEEVRAALKSRTYRPLPTRERRIPKANGKMRRLGIPALRDRVVQMAFKLILEPIFEVDFCPTSYGYRPARRAQDAIAQIVQFINPPGGYNYVVEGDIEACFDNVHHGILMQLVRQRITDRKMLGVIRAFLVAGVVTENGRLEATLTGTPQGGILSPLLANIYLSVLDRYFEDRWQLQQRSRGSTLHKMGLPTYRLIRYADDFVILVRGTRQQADEIRSDVALLLHDELRMQLSEAKTRVTHVDRGFDFLGHHVRRAPCRKTLVGWSFPSKKSLAEIKRKIKTLTGRNTTGLSLAQLLHAINRVLRGWTMYFRFDAAKRTFNYIDHYVWWRLLRWCRKKHPTRRVRWLKQRYRGGGWRFRDGNTELFRASTVRVERYRFRGTKILLPWMDPNELGSVGRFAFSNTDEPARLDLLQQAFVLSTPS